MPFYAEAPESYGYFREDPYLSQELPYGEVDPYGGYDEPPELGVYGEPELYGETEPGYSEYEPGYFAEEYPVGYFAEDSPYGEYEPMGYYGQMPEMVGYGQYEPLAQPYAEVAGYAEPEFAGYVRDVEPPFNAGCPMPTNVAGLDQGTQLEGYVRPTTVNATCERFAPQPGLPPALPETFRPLW